MEKRNAADTEYNFIKGKMGEAIVKRLFDALDMHVCHYGYEFITPSFLFLRLQQELSGEALGSINKHPDFLVCDLSKENRKERKVYKIEVKYKKDGRFSFAELLSYDPDVHFLFLDDENFRIASYADISSLQTELEPQKGFNTKTISLLEDYTAFDLSKNQKETILAFKNFLPITFGQLQANSKVMPDIRNKFANVWRRLDAKNKRYKNPEIAEYETEDSFDEAEKSDVVSANKGNMNKKPKSSQSKKWFFIMQRKKLKAAK